MSVGNEHRFPLNMHPQGARAELERALTTGSALELMQRWNKIDFVHDIVYAAGCNVQGTTRYVDRDFARALYDPMYARELLGAVIETGLSPDDTLECILRHETVEKVLLDADYPCDLYDDDDECFAELGFSLPGAHGFATLAEHLLVREKGGMPVRYERGLEKIFRYCATKELKCVPRDYACAQFLDDDGPNAKRAHSQRPRVYSVFSRSVGTLFILSFGQEGDPFWRLRSVTRGSRELSVNRERHEPDVRTKSAEA